MIKDNLNQLIMSAMKNGDKARLAALRDMKKTIQDWETSKANVGKTLDDATEISLMNKLVKQCKETAEMCIGDVAETALNTIKVVSEFLPAPVTEDDIVSAFNDALKTLGINPEKKNMGMIIKEIKSKLPGADGKTVASIVSARLS